MGNRDRIFRLECSSPLQSPLLLAGRGPPSPSTHPLRTRPVHVTHAGLACPQGARPFLSPRASPRSARGPRARGSDARPGGPTGPAAPVRRTPAGGRGPSLVEARSPGPWSNASALMSSRRGCPKDARAAPPARDATSLVAEPRRKGRRQWGWAPPADYPASAWPLIGPTRQVLDNRGLAEKGLGHLSVGPAKTPPALRPSPPPLPRPPPQWVGCPETAPTPTEPLPRSHPRKVVTPREPGPLPTDPLGCLSGRKGRPERGVGGGSFDPHTHLPHAEHPT